MGLQAPILGAIAAVAGVAAAAVASLGLADQVNAAGPHPPPVFVTTPEPPTTTVSPAAGSEPTVEGHDAVVEDLARRVRQASGPEGGTDLVDSVTGLLDHRYFSVALERRISAARRKLSPLSLVVLELWPDDERQPRVSDQSMKVLAAVVRAVLREADTGCRIDDRSIAVILEETPEAGAVWATERVRGGFFATTFRGNVKLAAGIAAYPAHALEPEQLMAAAREATLRSREGNEQTIEIARVDESAGESGS